MADQPDRHIELRRMVADAGSKHDQHGTVVAVSAALAEIDFLRNLCTRIGVELRNEAASVGNPKARKSHEVALTTRLFALADELESQ